MIALYFGIYFAIGLIICVIHLSTSLKHTKYVPFETFIFAIICWPYGIYNYIVEYFIRRNFRNPFYRR